MKMLIMDIVKPLDKGAMVIGVICKDLVHISTYSIYEILSAYIHPLPKKSRIGYIIQFVKLVIVPRFDIVCLGNILRGVIGVLITRVRKSKLIHDVNGISLYAGALWIKDNIDMAKRRIQVWRLGSEL